MQEFRCKKCGRLLFKEDSRDTRIEIKCRSCKAYNVFEVHVRDSGLTAQDY